MGVHTTTSGFEGAWNSTPTQWDNNYLETLMDNDWELTESPAGHKQWTAPALAGTVPDAHDASITHAPMMSTADMAMKMDPIYGPISQRFRDNPEQLDDAFARAWYKLTHRDMGPVVRYLGPEVPSEELLWQDPIPAGTALSDADVAAVKAAIMATDLTVTELVETAWASASTYRQSDKRGGANGGRLRLAPQNEWDVNKPAQLRRVLSALEGVQSSVGVSVSMADLIVLGGAAAVEAAAKAGGHDATRLGEHRAWRCHPGADRRRVVRMARATERRLPELPGQGQQPGRRAHPRRPSSPARSRCAGDGGTGRWTPGPRCQQ